VRTVWFGTGEARLRSLVSKDRSYKPMVKSVGAQRESDGVVVPVAGGQPPVGKGPDFGHARGGGKCRGMAGTAGPTTLAGNLGPSCCTGVRRWVRYPRGQQFVSEADIADDQEAGP
jgi:hypothetical protein